MELSPYAKFANDKETYEKLKKFVDRHNAIHDIEIDVNVDPKAMDRAVKAAIEKSLKKHFK